MKTSPSSSITAEGSKTLVLLPAWSPFELEPADGSAEAGLCLNASSNRRPAVKCVEEEEEFVVDVLLLTGEISWSA